MMCPGNILGSFDVSLGPLKVISTSDVNFGSHQGETVAFTLRKNIQQTV